jgi:membrane protease YdiL (CAAX protease family)
VDLSRQRIPDEAVALGAMSLWMTGAVLSGTFGLWLALGSTSIVVGSLVLAAQPSLLAATLRFRLVDSLVGVLAGLLMVAASRFSYPVVAKSIPFIAADATALYAALAGKDSIPYALLIVPIAMCEEVVWRGAVQSAVVKRFGKVATVPLTAVLYALVHAPVGVPSLVLIAFACGLGWGLLRSLTAGLWAPFVAHLLWSEIMFFVAPLI